jgi:aryl-alcohol dehydrogenase-like predicted oxidoreductase
MEHHTISLGQTGLKVPQLGLGAMIWGQPTGWARWTPAQTAYGPSESADEEERAFEVSLAAGVNLVDTAEMYANGASENRVGELAQGRSVIIATKFPPSPFSRPDAFPDAIAASLKRLQRDRIDLYQHHFPSKRVPIPELMSLMAGAVEAGQVRAVGVSNYSAEQMRLAHAELAKRGVPLASNQVEYSLLHRQPETDGVLDACKELGVTLIAYTPLAGGALTGKYSLRGPKATGLRRFMGRFRGSGLEELEPVIELLRGIGARYGKSPNQVALRWLIEQGTLPIPGAKNAMQAASNVEALTFALTSDEVAALSEATAAWRTKGSRQ